MHEFVHGCGLGGPPLVRANQGQTGHGKGLWEFGRQPRPQSDWLAGAMCIITTGYSGCFSRFAFIYIGYYLNVIHEETEV